MGWKALLFDLDGTLVHTAPDCRYAIVGRALQDLGIQASPEQMDRFWFGENRNEIIRAEFNAVPSTFWEAYKKYDTVARRKMHVRTYDDVDFIQGLGIKGYKTGIVTGAPVHIASFEIGLLGEHYFHSIVHARLSSGIRPKPHPHGILECLKQLKVEPSQAAYIGNADEDILAARSAGVLDVVVLRGEHQIKETPSLAINSLHELRKFI